MPAGNNSAGSRGPGTKGPNSLTTNTAKSIPLATVLRQMKRVATGKPGKPIKFGQALLPRRRAP